MTAEEYIDSKTFVGDEILDKELIYADDAYEAVDMAKREIAWEVHKLICETHDFTIIDKYVTDICDF